MGDCLFCKIIKGEIPSSKVYEVFPSDSLCSLTTTINAIKGTSYSPITVGNNIGWSGPITISSTADVLKNKYSIDVVKCVAYQNGASGNELNNRKSEAKSTLTDELGKGNVAIVQIKGNFPDLGTTQAHYVVLCGIENNKVVIANSAGGVRNDVDMDYLLTAMFDQAETDNGYIVAKSQGTTNTNTNTSQSSQNSSTNTTNTGNGKGEVTSISNVNSTGYTGVFKSGTTGRSFKEYKQNGSTFLNNFDISSVGCDWGSECGTVSTIIVGSGYSNNANFADATQKLKSTGGSTYIDAWLKDYANEASVKVFHNPSDSQILKWLKDGCALVIHVPVYSGNGHYMAVLDVNQNDEIYISNPDSFGIERME